MLQRLTIQLPPWAQPAHPILRYELKTARLTRWGRVLRVLWQVVLLIALGAGGYLLATDLMRQPAGQNPTESLLAVLYWPLLIVQVAMSAGTLVLTGGTISEEQRRQTWDSLRATADGAALVIRTRWAAVFYRLRALLLLLIAARALLIAGILYDLMGFQGRYLDLLLNGITPDLPLAVAAMLLAFLMTTGLLLPITSLGFDAAVGLLVATLFQQRTYTVLAQIVLVLARLLMVGGLALAATGFMLGDFDLQGAGAWLLLGGFGAFGDWGLSLLNLGYYGEIWAVVPYGIFIGLGLLLFALIQAAATDWVLGLAIRRAERHG